MRQTSKGNADSQSSFTSKKKTDNQGHLGKSKRKQPLKPADTVKTTSAIKKIEKKNVVEKQHVTHKETPKAKKLIKIEKQLDLKKGKRRKKAKNVSDTQKTKNSTIAAPKAPKPVKKVAILFPENKVTKPSKLSPKNNSLVERKLLGEKIQNAQKKKSKSRSAKSNQKAKSAKALISKSNKRVVELNKRFIVTIVSCILFSAIIVGTVAMILRYSLVGVKDEAMTPLIEESQTVIVDTQTRIQRYDLVSFSLSSSDFSGEYIRRVIGLPGDSIWVENDTVFVNGSLSEAVSLRPQTYASQLPSGTYSFTTNVQTVIEELQGFSNIPSDSYLVLGDTNSETSDSRNFGLINVRNIQGVVTYLLWPLTQAGDI